MPFSPKNGALPRDNTLPTQCGLSLTLGASHILIRAADAYVLTHAKYTAPNLPPMAVLKTANGAPLAVIGHGTLTMGPLRLTAYIFKDSDLVNNLLGLAPLADRNCTTIFKPSYFHVYRHDEPQPILLGMRDSSRALWLVDLAAITPQHPDWMAFHRPTQHSGPLGQGGWSMEPTLRPTT